MREGRNDKTEEVLYCCFLRIRCILFCLSFAQVLLDFRSMSVDVLAGENL